MSALAIRFILSAAFCFVLTTFGQAQVAPPAAAAPPAVTAEETVKQASALFRAKQYDKAVDLYRQAIKLNPALPSAYTGLGGVYIKMERAPDAVEPLKTAIRLSPNDINPHIYLAMASIQLRRFEEAQNEINLAKQINPNDARVYIESGDVLAGGFGRFEEALAMYTEAQRLDRNEPYPPKLIGVMNMRLGRLDAAMASYQEALRLDPQAKDVRYYLSDTYSRAGRFTEAADSWSKYLLLAPNSSDGFTKLEWSYLYAGGRGRDAGLNAQAFIKTQGWKNPAAAYLAVMGAIGYRQAGMSDEAQSLIGEASKKIAPNEWTYQLVRYFNGEIAGEELMKLAVDNDKKTEAHTYLGMDALLKNKSPEAREHFMWVKDYGNKRFFEYPLAIEELKRMPK